MMFLRLEKERPSTLPWKGSHLFPMAFQNTPSPSPLGKYYAIFF